MIRPPQSVTSKTEFIQFVAELRQDLAQNPTEWENPTLERFLEAMAAWLQDTRQRPAEDLSWHFLAQLLIAASSYE